MAREWRGTSRPVALESGIPQGRVWALTPIAARQAQTNGPRPRRKGEEIASGGRWRGGGRGEDRRWGKRRGWRGEVRWGGGSEGFLMCVTRKMRRGRMCTALSIEEEEGDSENAT